MGKKRRHKHKIHNNNNNNNQKNNVLFLSRGDKTILALIANLNSSKRQYSSENEMANAIINIQELKTSLKGNAIKVADYILNPKLQQLELNIKNSGEKFINWAETL